MNKKKHANVKLIIPFLIAILATGYFYFGYVLDRTNFNVLFGLFVVLAASTYALVKTGLSLNTILGLSFIFRLIFIGSIPILSQDFYRFIWDGHLLIKGINPYLKTPEFYIANGELIVPKAQELVAGMGALNASHFSNYPPLNQLCFAIAAFLGGDSILVNVIVMRLITILADFGSVIIGIKLLKQFNLPKTNIIWYAANPFIIIELTGNLHMEGIMIFFLLLALYYLKRRKLVPTSISLAMAVLIKLVPLMFFPLFLKKKLLKKRIILVVLAGLACIVGFFPFFSEVFITNYSETVGLWFSNFEFNASIYYVIRAIGFEVIGYNIIGTYGKTMAISFFVFVLAVAYFKKNQVKTTNLIQSMLVVLTLYFFLSTTVHPWYIATLVALSLFTKHKFTLLWSVLIMLSYYAYSQPNFKENYFLLALQYVPVISLFCWELFVSKTTIKVNRKEAGN